MLATTEISVKRVCSKTATPAVQNMHRDWFIISMTWIVTYLNRFSSGSRWVVTSLLESSTIYLKSNMWPSYKFWSIANHLKSSLSIKMIKHSPQIQTRKLNYTFSQFNPSCTVCYYWNFHLHSWLKWLILSEALNQFVFNWMKLLP